MNDVRQLLKKLIHKPPPKRLQEIDIDRLRALEEWMTNLFDGSIAFKIVKPYKTSSWFLACVRSNQWFYHVARVHLQECEANGDHSLTIPFVVATRKAEYWKMIAEEVNRNEFFRKSVLNGLLK